MPNQRIRLDPVTGEAIVTRSDGTEERLPAGVVSLGQQLVGAAQSVTKPFLPGQGVPGGQAGAAKQAKPQFPWEQPLSADEQVAAETMLPDEQAPPAEQVQPAQEPAGPTDFELSPPEIQLPRENLQIPLQGQEVTDEALLEHDLDAGRSPQVAPDDTQGRLANAYASKQSASVSQSNYFMDPEVVRALNMGESYGVDAALNQFQGEMQAAAIQAEFSPYQAEVMRQGAAAIENDEQLREFYEEGAKMLRNAKALMQSSLDNPIERGRIFRGPGRKLMAGIIGAIGGTFLPTLGRNPGLDMIHDAINQDLQAQMAQERQRQDAIAGSMNLYQQYQALFKDRTAAIKATYATMLAAVQTEMQGELARRAGPQFAMSKMQEQISALEFQKAKAWDEALNHGVDNYKVMTELKLKEMKALKGAGAGAGAGVNSPFYEALDLRTMGGSVAIPLQMAKDFGLDLSTGTVQGDTIEFDYLPEKLFRGQVGDTERKELNVFFANVRQNQRAFQLLTEELQSPDSSLYKELLELPWEKDLKLAKQQALTLVKSAVENNARASDRDVEILMQVYGANPGLLNFEDLGTALSLVEQAYQDSLHHLSTQFETRLKNPAKLKFSPLKAEKATSTVIGTSKPSTVKTPKLAVYQERLDKMLAGKKVPNEEDLSDALKQARSILQNELDNADYGTALPVFALNYSLNGGKFGYEKVDKYINTLQKLKEKVKGAYNPRTRANDVIQQQIDEMLGVLRKVRHGREPQFEAQLPEQLGGPKRKMK